MVRDVLYWPKHLRDKVKLAVQRFQREELKHNMAKIDLRDVVIVCVAEALPKVEKLSLPDFKQKLDKLKGAQNRRQALFKKTQKRESEGLCLA